jgi:isopenicillin N synthase-like dioxygenase
MPHSTVAYNATIDGQRVDVASLETINFERLATKEPGEVEKLLHASQMPGFFYLDLQNEPTKEILADLRDVNAVAEEYFDEPSEAKSKDSRSGQDSGWVHVPHFWEFL